MGTWNAGSFGNDTALDFVSRLKGIQNLERAFDTLGPNENWIESDTACEAVAAADIVAAMIDRPASDLPQEIASKLASFGTADSKLIASAIEAIGKVRKNSELADLWAESPDEGWANEIANLLARLDLTKEYVAPVADPTPAETIEYDASCCFCGASIPASEVVTLTVEVDGDVWFSSTQYAHSDCIEKNFQPPHFNDDGTPHSELLAQVKDTLDL